MKNVIHTWIIFLKHVVIINNFLQIKLQNIKSYKLYANVNKIKYLGNLKNIYYLQ